MKYVFVFFLYFLTVNSNLHNICIIMENWRNILFIGIAEIVKVTSDFVSHMKYRMYTRCLGQNISFSVSRGNEEYYFRLYFTSNFFEFVEQNILHLLKMRYIN